MSFRYCARVVAKPLRFLPALGAVLFAGGVLNACGGVPGDAVVSVNGSPITKATFNHWMGVAAAATATSTGTPAAKPVIPEPPKYTACISHLEATTPKPAKGQPPTTRAQFKVQCEQQYKSLQQEVLGFLISSEWVLGEASSLGVKVSDKEVHKRFQQIKETQFPKPAEFEKFLTNSGQTISDLLLRVKLNLMSSKIQQKIIKSKAHVTPAQVKKYYEEHKQRFEMPEKRAVNIILTKTEAAAQKAKQDLERLHAESAEIIRQSRVEADAIIARSRGDAERVREEMKQKARAEAEGIVKSAERQIQLETTRALEQIRHEAVDLSVMIASKIIQRNLSKEDNERLIDEALRQVAGSGRPDSGRPKS